MLRKVLLIWGVMLLPFLFRVPILDYTFAGSVIRGIIVALTVMLAFLRINMALKNMTTGMKLYIGYMFAIGTLSMIIGLYYGRYADPSQFAKFYILQILIFVVGLSYNDRTEIETVFRWFYYIGLFAAIQAIAALVSDYFGIRQFGEIEIDRVGGDYRYMLSWYGLLGGDVWNGRTNFYFSESTHFAHFLFPGIAYAMGTRRLIGMSILLAGFVTTFAGFAGFILTFYLFVWFFLYARNKDRITVAVILTVLFGFAYLYSTSDESLLIRLFSREQSLDDKQYTYTFALTELFERPYGVGPFDTSEFYGDEVNTSGGLFGWIVWFGWLGFPAIFILLWSLLRCSFGQRKEFLLISMSLGLFFLSLATFSHGPLPKYYMVFLFGLLFRYSYLIKQSEMGSRLKSLH